MNVTYNDCMPSHLTLDIRSYNHETLAHEHDYHQLVLPVKGDMELTVGSNGSTVGGNSAAIITAGKNHGCFTNEDNHFLVADVPSVMGAGLERMPEFIELDPVLSQYVNFLYQQKSQSLENSQIDRQMLLLLIQLLLERHGQLVQLDKRVELAKRFLDEHYQEEISLNKLALTAHLSPRQLTKLFREQLGLTPQQYQIELRMQTAWKLFESGEKSIQSVAGRVGYTNFSSFSDRFRKHFGKSPRYFI